jgi:hypothetical protein
MKVLALKSATLNSDAKTFNQIILTLSETERNFPTNKVAFELEKLKSEREASNNILKTFRETILGAIETMKNKTKS